MTGIEKTGGRGEKKKGKVSLPNKEGEKKRTDRNKKKLFVRGWGRKGSEFFN